MGVIEVYHATKKVPDLFWNRYVCRPIAAVFVRALADTKITPNQVTLVAFAIACVAAAMLVWLPGYWGLLAAVLVYQLSYVFDCVDGMLARWRKTQSTTGHLLDFLMDEIKAFVVLAAASVRLYFEHHDVRLLYAGLFGLVCLASGIGITTFQRRPEIAGTGSPPASAGVVARRPDDVSLVRRGVRLAEGAAKFLIHYPSYILYAALLGRLELYFFPYVVVNALYVVKSLAWVTFRFGLR